MWVWLSCFLELSVDPGFNVAAAVAEMSADSKSGGSLVAVPPGVDRGERNPEAIGHFPGAEQPIEWCEFGVFRRVHIYFM